MEDKQRAETAHKLVDILSKEDLKELLAYFGDRFPHFELNPLLLTVESSGNGSEIKIWEFFHDGNPERVETLNAEIEGLTQTIEFLSSEREKKASPRTPSTEQKSARKELEKARELKRNLETEKENCEPRRFRVVKTFTHESPLRNLVAVPSRREFYMWGFKKEKGKKASQVGIIKWTEAKGEFVPQVFATGIKSMRLEFAISDGSLFATRRSEEEELLIRFSPEGKMTERKFGEDELRGVFPLRVQNRDFVAIEDNEYFTVLRADNLSTFDRIPSIRGDVTIPFSSRDKFVSYGMPGNRDSVVWTYVLPLPGEEHGQIKKLAAVPSVSGTLGSDFTYHGNEDEYGLDIWTPSEKKDKKGLVKYKMVQTLQTKVPDTLDEVQGLAENLMLVGYEIWKNSEGTLKKLQEISQRKVYAIPASEFARGKMVDFLDSLVLPVPKDLLGILVDFSATATI